MKNRFTLFFAALMMTLGVCAQEGSTVEQRGAEKGYYPFAAEITGKEKLTSLDQITDGMEIMIERDGSYLTIYSLPTYGAAHIVFMQNKPVGVGVWTTKTVDANAGTFQLKSAHMMIIGGDAKCYLGQLDYNSQNQTYLQTTGIDSNIGAYKFVPAADGSGKWNIQCANNSKQTYLAVDNSNNITEASSNTNQTYFNIYKVTSKSTSQVKYVEASVKLTGQGGNTITGTHQGWNDFYEFYMSGDAYGCDVSNVYYNEGTNTITGDIAFPFPVTGDYLQVPVYLHPDQNVNNRLAVVDDKLTTLTGETGNNNQNSQWYIKPRIVGLAITYALYNIGAKKYVSFNENSSSRVIGLSDSPSYFKLNGKDSYFFFQYVFKTYNDGSQTLYHLSGTTTIQGDSWTGQTGAKYTVSTVSSANADLGFIQKYPVGTSFWNKGVVNINDETQCPASVKAMLNPKEHEFLDEENTTTHKIYCASTAIKVNSRSDISVTFTYDGGGHLLNIFGVDIVHLDGTAFVFDYHQGTAGSSPNKNTYTLKNVPAGEYRMRYFVCNTPELTGDQGHNLDKNAGTITVTGANLRLKPSDAPNGDWADNTNWYTINQGLCTGNRICAEPAYTDWSNNLMLDNNDVAMNSAALWCFVGDATNGYKIYNRAWGADYALATTGSEENARTMMKPVAEASIYDVDFHAYQNGKGQFFIRMHNSTDFLNDRGGYLAKWNTEAAYETDGSVMMINEVLNTEVFDNGLTPVVEKLQKEWAPWTGDGANADINTAYANNSSFASWVLGRQQLAELLNGKVFKFVNKATDNRGGRILGVNESSDMMGLAPSDQEGGNVSEFVQLYHNGNGTYNLLHLGTDKYFGVPDDDVKAGNIENAAKYSFVDHENDPGAVIFIVGTDYMMNLGDRDTRSYKLTNWQNHPEAFDSHWAVTYDQDAQNLADLIAQAKARYAETQADAYQANVGVPGYANAESTTALFNTFNGGLSGMTFENATNALNGAMNVVAEAEKEVFFPTDCYFTITNRGYSLVYNAEKTERDDAYSSEFVWTTDNVDATNPKHLWGFYLDEETGDYYLYNVGRRQFVNSKGKGDFGDNTWIFSDFPVTITMKALDTPYFHIEGDNLTLSVSTGYTGPVITYYADGDQGVPMRFNKSTVAVDQDLLNELKSKEILDLTSGFYTLKYNDLYLNDKTETGKTIRTLTAMTDSKIENIFYYTPYKEMVGYSSGYGFTYGYCNTGKPEAGYNTFTFKVSHEPGKYLIKSNEGNSVSGWGDRYLIVNAENNFTDDGVWNKKLASAWTIEKVTELPVKLNKADDGYAYATLYTPVALTINDAVEAYTGVVSDDRNYLLLRKLDGVIPAGTGVVLKTTNTAETGIYNFAITTSEATADADNVLKGDIFTTLNEATYYSLNNVDGIGFYKYTGANLTGFRARISGEDADVTKLTFRFGNPTGIEGITSAPQNEVVYDLSGRRVATPKKGLYIVNGKKVFIK